MVTGASSGVGRAIALALAHHGAQLYLIGRNAHALAETVAAADRFSKATSFQIDLTVAENLKPLFLHLEKEGGRVDILIHSAGVIHQDVMERARVEDFDRQYATNVRAPYVLTKSLLPMLTATHGQVVFINSSAGLNAKRPEVGQYSATKHALKAIADSLREEVNPKGIRVLTLYLGRTATPLQEALYRLEGKTYNPEALIQPEDVAFVVVQALLLPLSAELTDISIRPMIKA